MLPEDHYAVYKNITKYSIWELEDLLQLNGLTNTEVGRRRLNEKTRVLTEKQFHENRSHIRKNLNSFGIPQGSPISALLANIYMLVVDKRIKESVDILHGLYMRYSDDFVIVLPGIGGEAAKENFHKIMNEFNDVPGLTLQPEKTQFFSYDGEKIENCGKLFFVEADCGHKFINFLGFTFDGSHISIRSKTTSKYYYRMRRKAKTILKTKQHQPNTLVGSQNLYKQYSERGSYGKKGNFLTYVRRAKKVFGSKEKIDRDTKRHMQKIRQAMTKERNRK